MTERSEALLEAAAVVRSYAPYPGDSRTEHVAAILEERARESSVPDGK